MIQTMKVEKVHNKVRYTLSNENLNVGDEVFPIAWGRCLPDCGWILHNFDFRDFMSGFPDEPNIIKDLNYDSGVNGKKTHIRTDKGYSHRDCYFKIVKVEERIKVKETAFGGSYEWVEVKNN